MPTLRREDHGLRRAIRGREDDPRRKGKHDPHRMPEMWGVRGDAPGFSRTKGLIQMNDRALPKRSNFHNLSGRAFGRLTVLAYAGIHNRRNSWLCRCQCGKDCVVSGTELLRRNHGSCGCAARDAVSKANTTHGYTRMGKRHPLWSVWRQMRRRCHDPRVREYRNYGARGIVVCDEWRNAAAAFIAWGLSHGCPKPSPARHWR